MKISINLKAIFYLAISIVAFLLSCDKKSPEDDIPLCEQPPNVTRDLFSLILLDKNGTSLIGGHFSEYEPDSIQIFNEDFSLNPKILKTKNFVAFGFVQMPKDSVAYLDTVQRTFFIRLDSLDTDTLSAEFKLIYIEECFVTQFQYLKILYNDSLYYFNDKTRGYPYRPFYKL
jgi:hypothetical protein